MASNYELRYTRHFESQWMTYDQKTRDLIRDKLRLLKENPYRYPTQKGYRRVHKIKISIKGRYQRLMYAIHYPENNQILILGVFPRERDYKDFERKFTILKKWM